jgi:hypothetical protein
MTPIQIGPNTEIAQLGVWCARASWATATAFYVLLEDTTTLKLRVYRSDDGITWLDRDGDNALTYYATSGSGWANPYSTWLHTDGYFYIIYFTAANTLRVRRFDTMVDAWELTDFPASDVTVAAHASTSLRIVVCADGDIVCLYANSTTQQPTFRRWNGATWGTETVLQAVTAFPLDAVVDATDRVLFYWNDATGNDLTYRTLTSADVLGTVTDFDAAVNTTTVASSNMCRWNDGTNLKVGALGIDTGGEVDFYHGIEGATLGSTTTVNAVSTSTAINHTSLACAVFNNQVYVGWSESNAVNYDKSTSLTTLTFGTDVALVTGRTDGDTVPQFLSGLGGLGMFYMDAGSVWVEWITLPTSSSPWPANDTSMVPFSTARE